MRAAFVNCLWRWHSYDEDEAEQQRFKAERVEVVKEAVTAESLGETAEPRCLGRKAKGVADNSPRAAHARSTTQRNRRFRC